MVQELVTDDHLTLTKNENYWNGSPKLDKLTIRTISDGDTLSAALQAGNIDAAYGMAYEAYPNFENDDYQFSAIQTSRAFFASMNMASPVMQGPAVRKAIAMGIDKQGFVTALLDGHGVVGTGAFPDGFSSFGGEHVTTESYDPEGARQVLEGRRVAGYRRRRHPGEGRREADRPLADLSQPPGASPAGGVRPGHPEGHRHGGGHQLHGQPPGVPGGHEQLGRVRLRHGHRPLRGPQYFFTSCCVPGMSYNFGGYDNAEVTEMVSRLAGEFDTARRSELAIRLQQAILDDNAYVFCSFLEMNMISRSYVTGYTAHACDYYQVTAGLDIQR